jgi:HlyD family secretion protein
MLHIYNNKNSMNIHCSLYLLLTFCLYSCADKRGNGIITYQLKKADYIEEISVPGTVQAVSSVPVNPPRTNYLQMRVDRLAEDGAFVKKGDTLCVLSQPELVTVHQEALTLIENLEAELKKGEADNKLNIAMLEAQLKTSVAQMKIASLDSLQLMYATETNRKLIDLEMRKAVIEKQKMERKLASAKMAGESDIMRRKARVMEAKMRDQTYVDQIRSMTLIAQRDGVVIRTSAPTVLVGTSGGGVGTYGGPVKEGSVIIGITTSVLQFPDLSRMQISTDVAEADFKRIEKGQMVNISVPAAQGLVTTGKINRKNFAPSLAMRSTNSKVKFFEVIIDVDSCHAKMRPGLSANCDIILKQEKDTVFVPSLAIFEKDSSRVVYVKEKEEFKPVKVKTGTAGSSYTIITGGLKGDEIIALSEPPNRLITNEYEKNDTISINKH